MSIDFEPVQFKYSIFWSIFYTALLLLLVIMPVAEMMELKTFDEFALWFGGISELILLPPLIYIIIKAFIPMLRGKVALEINSRGIFSGMKNTLIEWDNIQDIAIVGGNTMALLITFKWETNNRKSLRLPLQLVRGKDYDIYGEAAYYLENRED